MKRASGTMDFPPGVSLEEKAFRKAIIAVRPDYFAQAEAAQERYRLDMPESDRAKAIRSVLWTLFGIRARTNAQIDAALEELDDGQTVLFQSAMLFFDGIGEDQFFLNEFLDEGETLLDFGTVYDYDHKDFCFQQEFFQREDSSYVTRPYRGSLYHRWARLRIDGRFFYATLCMAEGYLHSSLKQLGREQTERLIPHRCGWQTPWRTARERHSFRVESRCRREGGRA